MSEAQPAKPMAKVTQVSAFPLRGRFRDMALHPEGLETGGGMVSLPADPVERQKFIDLIDFARPGGPTAQRR